MVLLATLPNATAYHWAHASVGVRAPGLPAVALSEVTREAVLAAVAECDRLGQAAFLERYGFAPARQYVLVYDGKRYDSKAIAGVAHGFLPGKSPLASAEFSGGEATVGRLLRRLGFTLQVGDALTADGLVQILSRLQVFYKDGLLALYQPITVLWAFGRAVDDEPRLASWAETTEQLGELFLRHGRAWESDRVFYPIAALHGAGLWELDADPEAVPSAHGSSLPQRWFEERQPSGGLAEPVFRMIRDSPEARSAAVSALVGQYLAAADATGLLAELGLFDPAAVSPAEASFGSLVTAYQRLCAQADIFWRGRDGTRVERTAASPVRSTAARRAVLLRSGGRCENPGCTGDIRDCNDRGVPLLDVDHIHDLAQGGPDDPRQMIALCPNCHRVKTHGRTRETLRETLFGVALERHEAWSGT
jgi:5-methylcytosine-specific restriction enzyme A